MELYAINSTKNGEKEGEMGKRDDVASSSSNMNAKNKKVKGYIRFYQDIMANFTYCCVQFQISSLTIWVNGNASVCARM